MILLEYHINGPVTQKDGKDYRWVERYSNGKIKAKHQNLPKIGDTLILDPYTSPTPYQTKPIEEILEVTDTKIKFKTEDFIYTLYLPKYFQNIYEKLKD